MKNLKYQIEDILRQTISDGYVIFRDCDGVANKIMKVVQKELDNQKTECGKLLDDINDSWANRFKVDKTIE